MGIFLIKACFHGLLFPMAGSKLPGVLGMEPQTLTQCVSSCYEPEAHTSFWRPGLQEDDYPVLHESVLKPRHCRYCSSVFCLTDQEQILSLKNVLPAKKHHPHWGMPPTRLSIIKRRKTGTVWTSPLTWKAFTFQSFSTEETRSATSRWHSTFSLSQHSVCPAILRLCHSGLTVAAVHLSTADGFASQQSSACFCGFKTRMVFPLPSQKQDLLCFWLVSHHFWQLPHCEFWLTERHKCPVPIQNEQTSASKLYQSQAWWRAPFGLHFSLLPASIGTFVVPGYYGFGWDSGSGRAFCRLLLLPALQLPVLTELKAPWATSLTIHVDSW